MKSVRTSHGRLRFTRTRAAVAVLTGVLTLGLVACGSGSDEPAGSGEPVTITHSQGETTVTGTPERIVALGNQWLDTVQALGVTPVGYIDNISVLTKSLAPWEPESLKPVKALDTTGSITEQVAALNPDLILVDAFIADAKTYGDLSKIAPTVPGLTKEAVTPWADQVTALGKILHKDDAAAKVISDLNGRIDGIAQRNPGLKGKTFVSSWLAGPSQLMVLTDPADGSSRLFTQLGMTIPASLVAQGGTGGRLALSPERLDELNSDLLLAGYSPGQDEKYRQLPGYSDLPAVKKNAVVFLTVQEISAVNQPTPLALPYLLDKLEPALANAAK
ncbi:ABC transporter substrate-binding protein [Nocardia huaxiensis]|uniref:ABC transporter substrate-binding protein n=1 Tax=Nocardia huaxiensis TaxID=2755382 RepID=UPI001E29460C|nr:ABC transporter substrate-binding protein [Nocardia huaxiensis]UFS95374.1 ABC transporter substrate-binding protein [Nocardia huaxiensis]